MRIFPDFLIIMFREFLFTSDTKPKLDKLTRDALKKHFASDVRGLSKLLNKDFAKWIR